MLSVCLALWTIVVRISTTCFHIKDTYFYSLLTNCTVLLEKLTIPQPVKKFPAFYGVRMFIIVFKRARHLHLSRATWIQTTSSQPISLRSIIILHSHPSLCRQSGPPLSAFPTTPKPCMDLLPHTCHMPRPSHQASFDHPDNHELLITHSSPAFTSSLLVLLSFLAPHSWIHSAQALPLVRDSKCHTHTKQQAKL